MLRSKSLFFIVALVSVLLFTPFHFANAQEAKTTPSQVGAQPSDDAVLQRFLDWLPSAKSTGSAPMQYVNEFRSRLTADGTSAAEVNRQSETILRMFRERPDALRLVFNKIYASSTPDFVTKPNALLVSTIEGRKPGRALDIGMGEGRNAVFLAVKGWEATGFDVSDEGIAVARKNAERAGVKINAVHATDEAFDYGSDRWDLIVFMYEQLPVTSTAYVERLGKSMKSGGLIVIETYGAEASMPNRQSSAIDPAELLAAFKNFRLLHYEDTVARADWSPPGTKTRIVRMVAEKRP